jgi:hypothetical protein
VQNAIREGKVLAIMEFSGVDINNDYDNRLGYILGCGFVS